MRVAQPPRNVVRAAVTACVALLSALPLHAANWESYPAYYERDEWSLDWSPTRGLQVEAHRVARVNRAAGAGIGRIRIWDTFYQRLIKFHAEVRDTLGRVLFTFGPEEIRSVAPFSDFRLYSGDVIRAVDLTAPQPPYVIEAQWTVEIDNPFFWPDWVLADPWPRRSAVYRIAIPFDREVRHRQAAAGLRHKDEHHPRRAVTIWELNDWAPPDSAADGNGFHPLLYLAPVEFRFGGLTGRTDSWEALGRWYWELTSDRLALTDDQRRETSTIIKDVFGDRAKAAALKDWVSDRWRYVAIEVGIGGWRPHPAREVFVNRYGDCKDMVFLWVALMRQVGLQAHPALIRARNPLPIDPTFPKDWFDHVIGMAVINGDTLWADLSDRRYPLGTLPHACESRSALVVGDYGGLLVQTPSGSAVSNQLVVHTEGRFDTQGSLDFSCRVLAGGHFARLMPLGGQAGDRSRVAAVLGIRPPAVEGQFDRVEVLSAEALQLALHGRITGWGLAARGQMQIHPSVSGYVAGDSIAGRPDPGYVDFPQMVVDTLVLHVPPGWAPEFWPAAPFRSGSAGEFGEVREFQNGTLTVVRHLRWESGGRSDAERREYAGLRAAYRAAQEAEWLLRPNPEKSPTDTSALPGPSNGTLSRQNGPAESPPGSDSLREPEPR